MNAFLHAIADALPQAVKDSALWAAFSMAYAYLGTLARHVIEVRRGRRKAFTWQLITDIPIAAFMAFVGDGLASLMGLSGKPTIAFIGICAYLGPEIVISAARRIAERDVNVKVGG